MPPPARRLSLCLLAMFAFTIEGAVAFLQTTDDIPVTAHNSYTCDVKGCDKGTCNYAEQACRCQYGYKGRLCDEYALRSCALAPTDYPEWLPPPIPPTLWGIAQLLPVSCMCLSELRAANGVARFRQEVPDTTPCFVRVPTIAVTPTTLYLHQHSSLEFDAVTGASAPGDFVLLETTLARFEPGFFRRACSVPPTELARHRGVVGVQPPCRQLAGSYSVPLGLAQAPGAGGEDYFWVSDALCARGVGGCEGVHANNSGWGGNGILVGGSAPFNYAGEIGGGVWDVHGWVQLSDASCCPRHVSRCVAERLSAMSTPGEPMYANARCACRVGLEGSRCEAPCWAGCLHQCSGNGECVATWCKCRPGWFGIDCSIWGRGDYPSFWRAGTPVGLTLPPPRSISELKIYVYDVQPYVLQAEPCLSGCNIFCGEGIYKANIFFLSSLLKDPAHRTDNPNEAHLFFAPLMLYRYAGDVGQSGAHILDTMDVIKSMGYFERNGGRDHVWFVTGDQATCDVPPEARAGIIIGHYGRLDPPQGSSIPCVDPRKDLIVPPLPPASFPFEQFREDPVTRRKNTLVVYLQPWGVAQAQAVHDSPPPPSDASGSDRSSNQGQPERSTFLFVAANNKDMGDPVCANPEYNGHECRDMEYSMGVRAALFRWFSEHAANEPDIQLFDHAVPDLYGKLRSSKFCLDALGRGFSARIVDYVVSGCIPVIVRDDVLWPYESFDYQGKVYDNWLQHDPLPGEEGLPPVLYQYFAVSFHKREVPEILDALRGMSEGRVRALQEGVRHVHRAFLWDQDYGLAYNYTIAALARLRARMDL